MKIGIIGAMEKEIENLKEHLRKRHTTIRGNFTFYEGMIKGKEVVILLSGIGKVNAAVGTTLLIEQYQPDYIINTGSAGGISPDVNFGDVVIASKIQHHDVDARVFRYDYGQVPGMPRDFCSDPELVKLAEKSAYRISGANVLSGTIGTGDSFVHRKSHIQDIVENIDSIMAVEMEAASIAQTCHTLEVPFIIVRAISDLVGKEKNHTDFEQHLPVAASNSAALVLQMVDNL